MYTLLHKQAVRAFYIEKGQIPVQQSETDIRPQKQI